MYQKERLDSIMAIVMQNGYVTVKYLVAQLHYSKATINRDLNVLEAQKRLRRSYGGVEVVSDDEVPLSFRYHKRRVEKVKICKKASEFIQDGDVIFIDAATTTEPITEFLADKKDLLVITNNMTLVKRLSEMGIRTVCTGGEVVESPCMLAGADAIETASRYHVDKFFFSVSFVDKDGRVATNSTYFSLHSVMLRNADEVYLLSDSEKFSNPPRGKLYLCDLQRIKAVISDAELCEETKKKFPNTLFIKV